MNIKMFHVKQNKKESALMFHVEQKNKNRRLLFHVKQLDFLILLRAH